MKTKFLQNKKEKNQRFFQSNFFPKNRKADVPVMILVIGVVTICILAISSFIIVGFEKKDFLRIELFEEIHSDVEKFYFYKNLGFENQESVDMVNQNIANTVLSEEDKLVLDGNQLIIERGNKFILIKYTRKLE